MISPLNIDCVIPAAGLSSRLEANKLLQNFGGKPLLCRAVDNALAACRTVVVVVGHDESKVRAILPQNAKLKIVSNPGYRRGMLTSIARGAAEVGTDLFFVAPADMPFITPQLYEEVASAAQSPKRSLQADPRPVAWIPDAEGRRGHPVLIASHVIPELLLAVRGGSRTSPMRQFLSAYHTVAVPVDGDGSIIDIDTMADLDRFATRAGE